MGIDEEGEKKAGEDEEGGKKHLVEGRKNEWKRTNKMEERYTIYLKDEYDTPSNFFIIIIF